MVSFEPGAYPSEHNTLIGGLLELDFELDPLKMPAFVELFVTWIMQPRLTMVPPGMSLLN